MNFTIVENIKAEQNIGMESLCLRAMKKVEQLSGKVNLDTKRAKIRWYTVQIRKRYDAQCNCTALIYPDGKRVDYAYDRLGRLRNVTDWTSQVVTYTYTQM